jgi:hypothetical protein
MTTTKTTIKCGGCSASICGASAQYGPPDADDQQPPRKMCRNCRWLRTAPPRAKAVAGACNRCFCLIGPGLARMSTGDYLCLSCDQSVRRYTGGAVVRE